MSYRIGIDVGGTFTDFLLLGDDVRLAHKTLDPWTTRRAGSSTGSRRSRSGST